MPEEPNHFAIAAAAFAEGHPGPRVDIDCGSRFPNMLGNDVQKLIAEERARRKISRGSDG